MNAGRVQDGLGDAAMADELDVPPHCAVLRIGLQNRADPSGELLRRSVCLPVRQSAMHAHRAQTRFARARTRQCSLLCCVCVLIGRFSSYQQAFDVVLTGDQPLSAVTSLLRELLLPTLLGEVASVQAPQRTSGEQAP